MNSLRITVCACLAILIVLVSTKLPNLRKFVGPERPTTSVELVSVHVPNAVNCRKVRILE
jgi:hypothetical protein